ncbi:MAG TPA: magnesium/cobalt transporter CorA [Clostridia bacterium]|nr:magnesium/cobalt transporter CorA [Clostridia bacterium]
MLTQILGVSRPVAVAQFSAAHSEFYEADALGFQSLRALSSVPKGTVRWIDIDDACPEEILAALGAAFFIHPLVLENIKNGSLRTKIETYGEQIHLAAKMIYHKQDELVTEPVNFILGPNYVLSFGRSAGDVFAPIRSHIKSEGSKIRARGADYLLYSLLDAIVDGYFDVLELVNDRIDALEEEILENASKKQLETMRSIRKELLSLTRAIWPLRDVASLMGKDASPLISEETKPYFRDVYDRIVQAVETTDTSRELVADLTEIHFSNTSNKLNEVMRILTVISTIFIPLSFVTGVYGMNFRYMPLLEYKWGYYGTWSAMALIAAGMLIYFKRKKWF